MKITIRELECVVKITEAGSFIEAAAELGLSQPTLSNHISNIESHLNTKLFHRSRTGITPTAAGKTVYRKASGILADAGEIENSLQDISALKSGTLKIDSSTIPGAYFLPPYIKKFKERYPSAGIKMLIKDSEEVIKDLKNKSVDMGFIGYAPPRNLYSRLVFSDEIAVAVNTKHRWSSKAAITLDELLREPLIIRESGSGTRRSFMGMLRKKTNRNVEIHSIMGSNEAIRESVIAGLAPGVISCLAIAREIRAGILKKVKIKGISLKRDFHLVASNYRETTALCREFIRTLNLKK